MCRDFSSHDERVSDRLVFNDCLNFCLTGDPALAYLKYLHVDTPKLGLGAYSVIPFALFVNNQITKNKKGYNVINKLK